MHRLRPSRLEAVLNCSASVLSLQPTSEEKVTQDTSDAKKPEGKKKSKHHSKTNAAEKKKKGNITVYITCT